MDLLHLSYLLNKSEGKQSETITRAIPLPHPSLGVCYLTHRCKQFSWTFWMPCGWLVNSRSQAGAYQDTLLKTSKTRAVRYQNRAETIHMPLPDFIQDVKSWARVYLPGCGEGNPSLWSIREQSSVSFGCWLFSSRISGGSLRKRWLSPLPLEKAQNRFAHSMNSQGPPRCSFIYRGQLQEQNWYSGIPYVTKIMMLAILVKEKFSHIRLWKAYKCLEIKTDGCIFQTPSTKYTLVSNKQV